MKHAKIVDGPSYHLWTDALHGRALSHQARNGWDRGTYVRWTVTTAWTVLEMACGDALATSGIGRRFKDYLDQAVADAGLPQLDWGSGVWQRVRALQETRKVYVHLNISQEDLFPPASSADAAIACIREAIVDVYVRASKPVPEWVQDDADRGFHVRASVEAHASIIRAGVDPDAHDTIRISYEHEGREHFSSFHPAGTDPEPELDALIRAVNVPISRVRAYRGNVLIAERELKMRGA